MSYLEMFLTIFIGTISSNLIIEFIDRIANKYDNKKEEKGRIFEKEENDEQESFERNT